MNNSIKMAYKGHIRKTEYKDLNELIGVFDVAKKIQHDNGNYHQWTKNYPGKDLISKDVDSKISYVFDDGALYSSFMFTMEGDPSYDYIEGDCWLNDEPYGVIHRICSNNTHPGVLHEAVKFAKEQLLRKYGKINLRIDTHKDNTIMQHLLIKEGFEQVGIVYIDGNLKRIAFHLVED